MSSEVEIPDTPNWLKELEAKREKRLKAKLGHELGAGAPCLTCEQKCPGLDLHFWRKICKNCKCSKENHEVQDDDIYGWAQDELLGTKVNRLKRKIVLPGRKDEVELEWAPNGSKETIDKYLKTMPAELLPIKGSQAAQDRKQLLKKQIPIHDVDPTLCHDLTDEELVKMQEYICHIKQCSVGIGHLIQISADKSTTHVLDKSNAMFLINNIPKSTADSQDVILQEGQNSSLLENNRIGIQNVTAIGKGKPSYSNFRNDMTNALDASDQLPTENSSTLVYSGIYRGNEDNISNSQTKGCTKNETQFYSDASRNNSTNMMPLPFLPKHPSESKIEHGVNLLKYNPKRNNLSTSYQNPILIPPMRDVQYTSKYQNNQSVYNSDKPMEHILNELNQKTEYPSMSNNEDPFRCHIMNAEAHLPALSKSLQIQSNDMQDLINNTSLFKSNILLPHFTPGNAKVDEDERDPIYFKSIKDFAYSTYDNSFGDVQGNELPKLNTDGGLHTFQEEKNAIFRPDDGVGLEDNSPHPIRQSIGGQEADNILSKSHSNCHNSPFSDERSLMSFPVRKLDNRCLPNSTSNECHKLGEKMPADVSSPPKAKKPGDIPEYIPFSKHIQEEEFEPCFVPINGIRDIVCEENPEIRLALSRNNQFVDNNPSPYKYKPSMNANLPSCHFCNEIFKSNELAISIPERSDAVYHTNCFKCYGCNQVLADMFYFYDKVTEKIYCGRDYAKIRGIPRCRACDELIFVKEYCLAEYSTFHVKHFCCFECDKPLAGQNYVMENNQPMCVPCFELTKANKCYACKNVIHPDQQGLQLKDGVHFHATENCFACKVCKKSLFDAKLLFRSDRLYCSHDCYNSDI